WHDRALASEPSPEPGGRRRTGESATLGSGCDRNALLSPRSAQHLEGASMQKLISTVTVLAVAATTALAGDPIGPAALGPRTVRFTYEARVTPPAGAQTVELWVPLPREDDQSILDLKLAGRGHPAVVRLPGSYDRAAYVRVADP